MSFTSVILAVIFVPLSKYFLPIMNLIVSCPHTIICHFTVKEFTDNINLALKYIHFTEQKQKQYELSEESYFIAAEEMEEYGV